MQRGAVSGDDINILGLEELSNLRESFAVALGEANSLTLLNEVRVSYLGKKGLVSKLLSCIGSLPAQERQAYGAAVNEVKVEFATAIERLKLKLEHEALEAELSSQFVDVTLPARGLNLGVIHPLSKVIADVRQILESLGFTLTEGPEIEDDWHNFTALNIPSLHPARQMHDTFYIADTSSANKDASKLSNENGADGFKSNANAAYGKLLRTHTSNVQIRHMWENEPPHRIYSIGKVYRSDYDATHTPMFHQAEGLLIDSGITLGHLKWCLETFLQEFFEVETAPIRFRPSYFPFTEPSYEVDVRCDRSTRGEIKIGQGNDWLEILGCGMVHKNVLENVKVDTEQFQGFAFGIGIERLAMLKYGISDLRSFFHGDLRWLSHYGFNSI